MKSSKSPSTSRAALCSLIASLGLLLIAAATLMPIINGAFPRSPLYKIIFTAGAAVCLGAALFNKTPDGLPVREKRWHRIEAWSSIFFAVAAFFLWYPGSTPRDWLAFTMAGAVIRIIVFFRALRRK